MLLHKISNNTNVTGISHLSIGHSNKKNGYRYKRYLVTLRVDGKNAVRTFYFGPGKPQRKAYDEAIQYMIENGAVDIGTDFDYVYNFYEHEKILAA